MPSRKLERGPAYSVAYTLSAHQGDTVYLWDSPIRGPDRQNLTLSAAGRDDVRTVYSLTREQLAAVYLDIARILGRPPEPTVQHLRERHAALGRLLAEVAPVPPPPDFSAWGAGAAGQ